MEELAVHLRDRRIGTLRSDGGAISFAYAADYLREPGAEPLSFTLPLREEPYAERDVAAFLSGLLPDEGVRRRIAEILGLSSENTFGLLREIGEDCAGAIAFFAPGRIPSAQGPGDYRELSPEEAARILRELPSRPLDVGEEGFRISGAGAQDKLVACIRGDRIVLPLRGAPSTHIVKAGIPRFPETVPNELLCMRLARRAGLSAASCGLFRAGGEIYYATERFDRATDGAGRTVRLHQEDFCQLLRCDPKIKYESEGGPGIADCFRLLREMELPLADTIELLDRVVFNFLVGNGDAHAKNFSVLYRDARPRLAPAYDIVSTAVYPALWKRMAMKIGGEYNPRYVALRHFLRMGEAAGLSERLVRAEIRKVSEASFRALPDALDEVRALQPAEVYHDIAKGFHARRKQLADA